MTTRGRPRSFDRDAALDKAIRLFWRQGYAATSVRDLTDELGISAPSLYHAFGDKQQLFAEVVREYGSEYGGFIDVALAEETTARDAAARVFAEAPGRYTRRGLPTGCLVVGGDAGTTDVSVRRCLSVARKAKVTAFADKIQADVVAGILPADTEPRPLARYTIAVLHGLATAARDGVARGELERVAQVALRSWPD